MSTAFCKKISFCAVILIKNKNCKAKKYPRMTYRKLNRALKLTCSMIRITYGDVFYNYDFMTNCNFKLKALKNKKATAYAIAWCR